MRPTPRIILLMDSSAQAGWCCHVLAAVVLAVSLGGCGWTSAPSPSAASTAAKAVPGNSARVTPWPKDFNPPVDIRTEPVHVPPQIQGPSPPIEGAKK
jgi:hypothetical protein